MFFHEFHATIRAMTAPEWNRNDARASLLALAEFFHEHARQTIVKDGTHVELLFLLTDDGTMQPQPIAKPLTREGVAETLREQLPGSNVYGLIHIAEAWAYVAKGPRDHTFKQIQWGEIAVSELKEDDRTEILTVNLINRDGDSVVWQDEIIRDSNDKVSLGHTQKRSPARFPLGDVFTPNSM
jgi:hypothetical protein